MLLTQDGKPINPHKLPKGRKQREAVLADARELLTPHKAHSKLFQLDQRARLVDNRK